MANRRNVPTPSPWQFKTSKQNKIGKSLYANRVAWGAPDFRGSQSRIMQRKKKCGAAAVMSRQSSLGGFSKPLSPYQISTFGWIYQPAAAEGQQHLPQSPLSRLADLHIIHSELLDGKTLYFCSFCLISSLWHRCTLSSCSLIGGDS